ncbi:MAG: FUSC family protein [Planctomycetota bacterium]|jgi:uncharacterized membrane protein YccC
MLSPARRIQLQEAVKLAVSVTLFYWVALSLNFPSPKNGAIAIAVTSLGTVGGSFNKGLLRILGTAFGVVASLVIITGLAQYRWGFMLAMAGYVTAVSYLLQNSRHTYAWFLAGMTAAVVWSSSYMQVDNAFRVGLFRFVETAGGVVAYMLVSLVLWPRSAGTQVHDAGRPVLDGLRELFRRARAQGELPKGTAELRASVAGSVPTFGKTLDAAIADTPSIRRQRDVWRRVPSVARAFADAMLLGRLSLEDCRDLDLARLVPDRKSEQDTIARRLDRVVELWDTRDDPAPEDDADLLSPLAFEVHGAGSLRHTERMRLMNHVHELRRVDEASRALLRTLRVLAGLDARAATRVARDERPSRWDPERLLLALFPALSFVVSFVFWIYTNPPAGNAIPIIGIAFGLLLMMAPMNLFNVMKLLLVGLALMSPLYMFVLPRLETGAALLAVVFVSSFLLGLLDGRLAVLKTLGLVSFALITNITNRQSYSFLAVLYPMIMIMLGTLIVMAVYWFISAMQPEKIALRSVRRFFRGCTRMLRGFASNGARDRGLRRRALRFDVLPACEGLRGAQPRLEYERSPDNTKERVQRLVDALQLTIFRLQALEPAFAKSSVHPVELGASATALRETIVSVFVRWANLAEADEGQEHMEQLTRGLKSDLDGLVARDDLDEDALRDLWALMGGLRGLIETMAETGSAMREIRWDQWAVARF